MCKSRRWWKPTKHCEVVRSSGCIVVRWQKSDAKTRWNWAELHSDILLLIFERLGAIDILTTASLVCRNWNRLTWSEQMLWRRIDMTNHDFSLSMYALKQIAKIAVDRSAGKLEEFYADGFATDGLLLYIATRCLSSSFQSFMYDTEALHKGENMHELRSLQLIGNEMTNMGLEAILEGCPYLEFLDIRNCFNLVLNEKIMTKLSRIRDLKLPDNSADEYMDSISSYYYDYYIYGQCPCCFDPADLPDPHDDYDNYYYDTFSTLDDIYRDVMFL